MRSDADMGPANSIHALAQYGDISKKILFDLYLAGY